MMIGRTVRALGFSGLAAALIATAFPVQAQDSNPDTRIRRLESEVRALQRKVFPGGDGRYFEPEITGQPAAQPTVQTPSTTAVTDILARLDAMEAQVQRLTAQSEEQGNAIRLLTERMDANDGGAKSNAAVTSNLGTMTGTPAAKPRLPEPTPIPAGKLTPASATTGAATSAPTTSPTASKPTSARLSAVQAIAKPQTNDPGDDEYSYGFRLWDAGFYPEAQQQLTMFVEKYPKHSRMSYARNLLGRAYLDDGKAREAAPWFLKNYQTDKNGDRAGDSLLYLSESMIALKDTNRACIALAEFSETYPALATGRLKSQYEADRSKVKCK